MEEYLVDINAPPSPLHLLPPPPPCRLLSAMEDYLVDFNAPPSPLHLLPPLPPCRLLSAMEEYLVDFNATSKRPMNLAMFLFAVEHVSVLKSRIHPPRIHPRIHPPP